MGYFHHQGGHFRLHWLLSPTSETFAENTSIFLACPWVCSRISQLQHLCSVLFKYFSNVLHLSLEIYFIVLFLECELPISLLQPCVLRSRCWDYSPCIFIPQELILTTPATQVLKKVLFKNNNDIFPWNCCVGKDGFELWFFLLSHPWCWDCRCTPSYPYTNLRAFPMQSTLPIELHLQAESWHFFQSFLPSHSFQNSLLNLLLLRPKLIFISACQAVC